MWGLLTLHRGPRLSWGRDPAARVSRAPGAALPTHTGDLWPGSDCSLGKEGLEKLLALEPAWELIGSRAEGSLTLGCTHPGFHQQVLDPHCIMWKCGYPLSAGCSVAGCTCLGLGSGELPRGGGALHNSGKWGRDKQGKCLPWEEDGGHSGVWDVELEWFSDLMVSELLEDLLKQVALPSFLHLPASLLPAFVLLLMSPCLPDFHTEHLWGCPPRKVVQGAPVLCHPGAEQW